MIKLEFITEFVATEQFDGIRRYYFNIFVFKSRMDDMIIAGMIH